MTIITRMRLGRRRPQPTGPLGQLIGRQPQGRAPGPHHEGHPRPRAYGVRPQARQARVVTGPGGAPRGAPQGQFDDPASPGPGDGFVHPGPDQGLHHRGQDAPEVVQRHPLEIHGQLAGRVGPAGHPGGLDQHDLHAVASGIVLAPRSPLGDRGPHRLWLRRGPAPQPARAGWPPDAPRPPASAHQHPAVFQTSQTTQDRGPVPTRGGHQLPHRADDLAAPVRRARELMDDQRLRWRQPLQSPRPPQPGHPPNRAHDNLQKPRRTNTHHHGADPLPAGYQRPS